MKYYLVFHVILTGGVLLADGTLLTFQGTKMSLPIAALVHPRQEFEQGGDAFIFWNLAFSEGVW